MAKVPPNSVTNEISIQELINFSVTPDKINTRQLHSILHILAGKLDFESTSIKLGIKTARSVASFKDAYKPPSFKGEEFEHKKNGPDIVYRGFIDLTEREEKGPKYLLGNDCLLGVLTTINDRLEKCETTLENVNISLRQYEDGQSIKSQVSDASDFYHRSKKGVLQIEKANVIDQFIETFEKDLPKNLTVNPICKKNCNPQCIQTRIEIYKMEIAELKNLSNTNDNVVRETNRMMNKLNCYTNKKFKEIDDKLQINANNICKIRKSNIEKNEQLLLMNEDLIHLNQQIKKISEKILLLRKIRDIIQDLEEFNNWKKKIEFELEVQIERFELLKTIKANNCELKKISDNKVNRTELENYVTLEFFKIIQDDFSGGIVQILEQILIDEMQLTNIDLNLRCLINEKADKKVIIPMKKLLDTKIDVLNTKLYNLIRNRLMGYANAIKTQHLKNTNCIACTINANLNQIDYPVPKMIKFKSKPERCVCDVADDRNRYCNTGCHNIKYIDKEMTPVIGRDLEISKCTQIIRTNDEANKNKLDKKCESVRR